jgi:transposase
VTACAQLFDGREIEVDKERFGTTGAGVRALGEWLAEREVTLVVMEATGVYWKPVFYPLEGLFEELWLVNASHVKNVPGRKTDMSDAEWLADVAAHGMVRPSFVPPPPIRALRELTRYRRTQITARGQEIQRLEKLLQDAGIKLSSVASRVWSQSARAMIEALIDGDTSPERLAELAKGRMRAKIPALVEALEGRWDSHHSAVARRILAHIDFLDHSIGVLNDEISERLRPLEAAVTLLCTIPGVSTLTAEVIVAETGADMRPSSLVPSNWRRGRVSPPPTTNRLANDGPRVPARAADGYATRSSKPPRPPPAPKTPTWPRSTATWPDGEDPTRPPWRLRMPSPSPPGTCSSPARPTTTWAATSSSSDATPTAKPNVWSASSPTSASTPPSNPPPNRPHNPPRTLGATPRPLLARPYATGRGTHFIPEAERTGTIVQPTRGNLASEHQLNREVSRQHSIATRDRAHLSVHVLKNEHGPVWA